LLYNVESSLESSVMATDMISIPITLEQLIRAVQQLQPDEREQVAIALLQVGLRSDLASLIQELYAQPSVEDITDDDIRAEIQAVRQRSR
jgi:altronate dehydratase